MIYLGCYTGDIHTNGLKALELDDAHKISIVREYPVANALYQALSHDGKFLYSCTGEGLASFAVGADGDLEPLDTVALGNCLCHVSELAGRIAFADYLGGFAGSVTVDGGRFGQVVKHMHSGDGPCKPRQDKAHCHQALPLPNGAGYAVCDLGTDEIVTYPGARAFKTTPPGAGPRHLLFHPNGRLAFLVSELGNRITSLSWSEADGFRQIESLPTLENPAWMEPGKNLAAAIRFTPDMKRVVVSNRGENSLVAYDFDEATGHLAFKARSLLPGSWPRDFIFAGYDLALVAMERSGEVHALRYDADSGIFEVVSTLAGLHRPVALTCAGRDALR